MVSSAPDRSLYGTDFFAWTQRQAAILRARVAEGDSGELDIANLAEEIEGLGLTQLVSTKGIIRRIFVCLITAASNPATASVRRCRTNAVGLQTDLTDSYSPGMRPEIDLDMLWARARRIAESALAETDHGIAAAIPEKPPFDMEELLTERFDFDRCLSRIAADPDDRFEPDL